MDQFKQDGHEPVPDSGLINGVGVSSEIMHGGSSFIPEICRRPCCAVVRRKRRRREAVSCHFIH
jgi:hypothetical protein